MIGKITPIGSDTDASFAWEANGTFTRRFSLVRGRGATLSGFGACAWLETANAHPQQTTSAGRKPNILVIMGDDSDWYNPSIYHRGEIGHWTPNIDRIAKEGAMFTAWLVEFCTAGSAAFITGQSRIHTGRPKVGLPGADLGIRPEEPLIAEILKPLGYALGSSAKPPRRQG